MVASVDELSRLELVQVAACAEAVGQRATLLVVLRRRSGDGEEGEKGGRHGKPEQGSERVSHSFTNAGHDSLFLPMPTREWQRSRWKVDRLAIGRPLAVLAVLSNMFSTQGDHNQPRRPSYAGGMH